MIYCARRGNPQPRISGLRTFILLKYRLLDDIRSHYFNKQKCIKLIKIRIISKG